MLKVEDVQAITDYCRVLGHSAREAARVFQRSRNTVAKVLKEGVEGFRHPAGAGRRRKPRVLLPDHQHYIDEVLLGRAGGVQWKLYTSRPCRLGGVPGASHSIKTPLRDSV